MPTTCVSGTVSSTLIAACPEYVEITLELDYDKGRLIVCTLDLEDHVALDPGARLMAERMMDHALHAPLVPGPARWCIWGNRRRGLAG